MNRWCIAFIAAYVILLATGSHALAQKYDANGQLVWADNVLEPQVLTNGDIRMIQDALIWSRAYVGLKDGGWGPMTQSGVQQWRRTMGISRTGAPTRREISTLLGSAWKAKDEVGWQVWRDPRTLASVGYPSKLLTPSQLLSEKGEPLPGTQYKGSGNLRFSTIRISSDQVKENLNEYIIKFSASKPEYRLDRPDRQVAVISTANGRKAYIRYDRYLNEWHGIAIFFSNDIQNMVTALSAEFSATGGTVLPTAEEAPNIRDIIRWVINDMSETADGKPAQVTEPRTREAAIQQRPPAVPAQTEKIASAGTAFAINASGIFVTNAHVIAECKRVTFESGRALKRVAVDEKRDLAILQSPEASPVYLRLRRDQTVDLGEPVHLAGYPYFARISTTLNFTNGTVTAIKGVANNPLHFQLSANMQPGNSGSPVMDAAGLVIGVGVARLSDTTSLRDTGTVPQGMNYAIRGSVLESFLLENDILPEKHGGKDVADPRAIAKSAGLAVVPILCWQ